MKKARTQCPKMTPSQYGISSYDNTLNQKGTMDKSIATAGEKMNKAQATTKPFNQLLTNNLNTKGIAQWDNKLDAELKTVLNLKKIGISLSKDVMNIKLRDSKRKMQKEE